MITEKDIKRVDKIELANRRVLKLNRPLVMGILNVTPDSFSDGGKHASPKEALSFAHKMVKDGVDIIDIGGESSRPGSDPVTVDEELKRVIPIIKKIREHSNIPISIDTTKSEVASQTISAGADIINDISALRFDSKMAEVIAENKTPVVLMHMLGIPKTMQVEPTYTDCVNEIMQFFSERIHFCLNNGIPREKIILDPGIGFGKRLNDNLTIINKIGQFKTFGCPVLLGASRKSFIGLVTGEKNHPDKRIGGSLASAITGIQNGVDIIRVHDISETVEAMKLIMALKETV
ncbi:MAG: dihydropteroate synthase [candidate division Zixibacteria bacterium]|nr:dihydropteroate synthase [candidate division Zixibacteria bacterium]